MALQHRRKYCYFKENGITEIDYKRSEQDHAAQSNRNQRKNAPESCSGHSARQVNRFNTLY